MLKRLGYDKEVPLEFNNKRLCGLWLTMVGGILVISVLTGGKYLMNPIVFLVGYYICFYIANINKKVRKKLSGGKPSKFQMNMMTIGFVMLFVLIFFLSGTFIPSFNWRMIWLGIILATGIHFLIFYYLHGKVMIYLGIACILVAILGYLFGTIPFYVFGLIDGILKMSCGLYLLFLSKPSRSKLVESFRP